MSTHVVTEEANWASQNPADYQLRDEKGQPSGYATLDADGRVPVDELPLGTGGGLQFADGAYPARPITSAPVLWVGPVAPPSALQGDTWQFTPSSTPRPVIWSTDWWTDPEDSDALRILLQAERIGLIDVRAAVISTKLNVGPGSLDALAIFDGHEDLPIGCDPTYVPTGGTPTWQINMFSLNPHKTGYSSGTLSSVEVMRRALVSADDGTIDMIEVGYLTNLQKLLVSPGDAIDARTGLQLITNKVRKLWLMGGIYPTSVAYTENNFARDATAKQAAHDVMASWPTPVTFLGYEVGIGIVTGTVLTGTETYDPLAKAASEQASTGSWDSMLTMLAAVDDAFTAGYTTVHGTNSVDASSGINTFTTDPDGLHSYVVKAAPNRWYKDNKQERLKPYSMAPPEPPLSLQGVKVTASQANSRGLNKLTLPARTTATNLAMHLHADDLAVLGDTNALWHWEDRMRRNPVRTATSSQRPTFRTSIGGKQCVQFASGQFLASDAVDIPGTDLTIYARIHFTALPSSTDQVAVAIGDNNFSPSQMLGWRTAHLGVNASDAAKATGFASDGNVGTADTTGTLLVNTWHTITARINATSVEAFLDGISDGATSRANGNGGIHAPVAIGSRYWDQSGLQLIGFLREVRLYTAYHDNATVTATTTAMAA